MTEAGSGTPPSERIAWQEAVIERIVEQTPTVKSFFLRPRELHPFVAGQHVDIRLTAPDGYHAERSYSIASAPDGSGLIELAIERLDDGEVSPFFHEVATAGDSIEMRGPIGGHFVWRPGDGGPVLLVGGGSGVVPLMAVLRDRAARAPDVPMALVYSARRWSDVIFRDEIEKRADEEENFTLLLTLTREAHVPPGHRAGRIDRAVIAEALSVFGGDRPRFVYVCGATAFVEVAAMLLIEAGVPFARIRTERYGGAPPPSLEEVAETPDA